MPTSTCFITEYVTEETLVCFLKTWNFFPDKKVILAGVTFFIFVVICKAKMKDPKRSTKLVGELPASQFLETYFLFFLASKETGAVHVIQNNFG